ncbi:MAG TPA: glutaredoxin domain-containing protein [Polyangia bacterium]|nr:glutaredoxin domain-containing protein [Polyangia bacterium]
MIAIVGLVSLVSCRRVAPDAPPVAKQGPGTLEILKGGRWLFTYAEADGQFATTDKPEAIPELSRAIARVFDPSDPASKTSASGQVYIADLNQLLKSGKTQARPLSREAFETAALAQLPPGESSALAARPQNPEPAPAPAPPRGDGGVQGTPVVTLYGTSWCGACKTARRYFTEKNVPFADKDIERDPAAAQELAEKAAKMGVRADRVPMIDVRGRLLLGFDKARIEALLGEST